MTPIIIIIIVALVIAFVVIQKFTSDSKEDFAHKYARVFTHVYENCKNTEPLEVSIGLKKRRRAEQTIEAFFGSQFTTEDIDEVISESYNDNELALDLLIINSSARSISLTRGDSSKSIADMLYKDKHNEVLDGIDVAFSEIKRGRTPRAAQKIIRNAPKQRFMKSLNNLSASNVKRANPIPNNSPQTQVETPRPYTIDGSSGQFGYEETNPVPVKGQKGSLDYISHLQCKCGEGFYYQRLGSGGQCPDGHVVDVYELLCMSNCSRGHLFVDMYHSHPTTLIPNGLKSVDFKIGVGEPHSIQGFPGHLVNQRPQKKENITSDRGARSEDAFAELVFDFFDNSECFKLTAVAFTELFAFVYYEIDLVHFARKKPNREQISNNLYNVYSEILESRFGTSLDEHVDVFNLRVQQYTNIFTNKKDHSEVISSLNFNLEQSTAKGDYFNDGDPLEILDFFLSSQGKQQLSSFYIETFAPFLKQFITE